jgi:hypothetical protein
MREKGTKQRWSRGLRLMAILLAILGGLMPILIAIVGGTGQWAWLGQVGYLALGLAAGCVILDKFFGSSSGWTRYVIAAQTLAAANSRFRFDWNRTCLVLEGTGLTRETAAPLIELARDYVVAVDRCVEQETRAWIAEFQAGLALVDQLAKGQSQVQDMRTQGEAETVDAKTTQTAKPIAGTGGNGAATGFAPEQLSTPGGVQLTSG